MRILFIGGGNMASALIGGLLQRGFQPADLRVIEVSEEARGRLRQSFGVVVAGALDGAITEDVVLLAVKPQQMPGVAQGLRPHLRGQLVLSIAAGIRTADLSRWLGGHDRIARAMPNTPALAGAGMSGLYAAARASQADRDAAQRILGAVGTVVLVDREDLIDGVTAISGSGPAYVFYFIEALQQAALELGFDATQARMLATETFRGAAKLAGESTETAAVLRERVTSRGGTTERALKTMEAHGVKDSIVEAVHAAAKRSAELGDEFGRN
jgi:pyrroline-5-carboxylate reductase